MKNQDLHFNNQMKALFIPKIDTQFGYIPSLPYILKELYIDRWYERFLEGRTEMEIWDIGAYTGVTADYFSKFAKVIHAVEPNGLNFACLERTIKFNKLDKVKPYHGAITNHDGKVKLYYGGQSSSHNIINGVGGFEEVDGWTFTTLLDKTGSQSVDLMKIDVEGAEFELFGGKPFRKIAPQVKLIMGEAHSWANRNPNQVKWALIDNGFTVEFPKSDASVFVARRK